MKTKPIRICVEGAITDGRKPQREWLTDIEKTTARTLLGHALTLNI